MIPELSKAIFQQNVAVDIAYAVCKRTLDFLSEHHLLNQNTMMTIFPYFDEVNQSILITALMQEREPQKDSVRYEVCFRLFESQAYLEIHEHNGVTVLPLEYGENMILPYVRYLRKTSVWEPPASPLFCSMCDAGSTVHVSLPTGHLAQRLLQSRNRKRIIELHFSGGHKDIVTRFPVYVCPVCKRNFVDSHNFSLLRRAPEW